MLCILARKLSLTEVDGALTLAAAPAGLEKFRHSSYPIENHTTIRRVEVQEGTTAVTGLGKGIYLLARKKILVQ